MRQVLFAVASFAAAAAFDGALHADPAKPPPQLKFLTPADIDPAKLLPPPPVDYDDRSKAELAEVERIEATRTDAQFAAAKADEDDETPTAFAAVMGAGFDLRA